MELQEIAKKLEGIVHEAETKAVREYGANWKEKYEWLTDELRRMREDAEALRDDMKANALTVGAIEAEGFLRCAITVCSHIDRVEASYKAGA